MDPRRGLHRCACSRERIPTVMRALSCRCGVHAPLQPGAACGSIGGIHGRRFMAVGLWNRRMSKSRRAPVVIRRTRSGPPRTRNRRCIRHTSWIPAAGVMQTRRTWRPYGIPTDQLALYKTECPLAHAEGSRRPLGAYLQRLSWEPRGGPAWSRLGRQRLRSMPRGTGRTLYRGSRHATIFRDIGTPGCVTCHSNHAVLTCQQTRCSGLAKALPVASCHSADDANGTGGDGDARAHRYARGLITRARTRPAAARRAVGCRGQPGSVRPQQGLRQHW